MAGFARLGLAEPTPELTAVVHQAQARHLRALDDLRLVVSALGGAGVDVLVVKGPALVATCYAGPLLRSYVDLDVLVRPSQLREAVAALEAAGWTMLDANWPLLSSAGVGELKLEGPTGGALDLHWSFGKEGDPAPPVDTLMRRSVGVNDGELHYRTLGPADFAVHVALHAAASGRPSAGVVDRRARCTCRWWRGPHLGRAGADCARVGRAPRLGADGEPDAADAGTRADLWPDPRARRGMANGHADGRPAMAA